MNSINTKIIQNRNVIQQSNAFFPLAMKLDSPSDPVA